MSLRRADASRIAHRFRALRPDPIDEPGRRLWGDMVNAVTPAVPEQFLREWRYIAGWQREHDARGPA